METINNSTPNIHTEGKKSKNSLVRTISINLLMIFFIIQVYYYISEIFGAISIFYLGNTAFSIHFGMSLLLLCFLVILSGPYVGLISGFIGEFLVQMAIYNAIYLEWCIIVGVFGYLCGYYKYKPLKYADSKKIYLTFISLFLSSLLTAILMIFYYFIFYSNQMLIQQILVNYGFKFLLQALVSVVFLVPIMLWIYDKYLSAKERNIYIDILTHHPATEEGITHTFDLTFGRTRVYFCSRCSGVFLGGLFALFFSHLFEKITGNVISAEFALLLCFIAPIPGLTDWGSQRLLFRKSTTALRLITGFVIGMALLSISFTAKYYFFILFILIFYLCIFFILIYFGQKKAIRLYKQEWEQEPMDETDT